MLRKLCDLRLNAINKSTAKTDYTTLATLITTACCESRCHRTSVASMRKHFMNKYSTKQRAMAQE